MSSPPPTVLILGAGINGSALARELALNGLKVVVVDERDAAAGTTAYSSRLIHGGLRYLEYAEFDLVRESLAERTRWLRLAPHLVRPLRLFVPIRSRGGGLLSAARHFFHVGRQSGDTPEHRGLWAVGTGLWLYDRYARDPALPRRKIYAVDSPEVIGVDREKFRWLYAFSDAQLRYPERFTLALLEDAAARRRKAAARSSCTRIIMRFATGRKFKSPPSIGRTNPPRPSCRRRSSMPRGHGSTGR